MDSLDEKHIYKNALKRIVELDGKLQESFLQSGYLTGGESSKYFAEAVQIARTAITEGIMANVGKK
jgi:hypothetical protein